MLEVKKKSKIMLIKKYLVRVIVKQNTKKFEKKINEKFGKLKKGPILKSKL